MTMLVYGDPARVREPRALLDELPRWLDGTHDGLVTTFIAAGELAQGVADAEHAMRAADARSPTGDLLMQLLVVLAAAIDASWRGGEPDLAPIHELITRSAAAELPASIKTKRAEGHAFYAVYPEAYLAAARRLPITPDHVIGIRSIGTGLAALVAAATGAALPATVRPCGDPFRRELSVAPELVAEWVADKHATFAIADEGPGLSGSSFGAVLDLLEAQGIGHTQVFCFPSHAGALGGLASARHRERWRRVRKYVVDASELLRERLEGWIESLVGGLEAPLADLSAGAWRRRRYGRKTEWPPSFVQQERRKYLAYTKTGTWLARFAGLGETGRRALAIARDTSAAGFTPELAGLRGGFLVERWLGDARPLQPRTVAHGYLVERVGSYLRLRGSRHAEQGASCDELIEMVRRNVTLGVSADAAARISCRLAALPMAPVEIDGKLHPWEWLVESDGSLVKTDAYDHCGAHDLIGCQDIAWDVAAAGIELELAADEEARLAAIAGADPQRIAFLRPCYLAFQLGRARLAADASDPAEAQRLRAAGARYARLLTSRC